jgi:hypothetical protein
LNLVPWPLEPAFCLLHKDLGIDQHLTLTVQSHITISGGTSAERGEPRFPSNQGLREDTVPWYCRPCARSLEEKHQSEELSQSYMDYT